MVLLFKDFYNKFHFGFFNIVCSNYCMWNTEALYLGRIKHKKGIYEMYQVFDKIVAISI